MTELDFNKYEGTLKELEYISKEVGIPLEYTQGGGGNTSVKLDGQYMAVKASGCKLKQITPTEGYAIVDYASLREFFGKADPGRDPDFEKDSGGAVKRSIAQAPWLKAMRPSVEAGFHSVLKKYVIHTHSVYANMLTCIENGRELVEKIFGGKPYEALWIPYINPGPHLTVKIGEAAAQCAERTGREPEVFFMENHGLIVTTDDCKRTVELHTEVNRTIREYLCLTEAYPSLELFHVDDGTFMSKTGYIKDFIKSGAMEPGYFDRVVLYPDQLVYLSGSVSFNSLESKLNIITDTGEAIYKTGAAEAQTMEETLLACVYVINEILKRGLPLKTMSQKDIDFIHNWEGEAYRRKLAQEGK